MSTRDPFHRGNDDITTADTVPMSVVTPPVTSGARGRLLGRDAYQTGWRRPRTLLLLTLALAVVLGGGGVALAGGGSELWLFATSLFSAQGTPTATLAPTATPEPSATATMAPTFTPTAASEGTFTGHIDLGCGTTPLTPPSWVVRQGPPARLVALTFDDGPSPDWTATMLTTLEQTHTPATFFVVGSNVHTYSALVQREAADGFTIAMHTWDHPYMTKLSPASRAWELNATAQAIHAALNPHYCLRYWRPPFGDYNGAVVAETQAMGLTTVTWSVDPQDWSAPGVQVIVDRVLAAAFPGCIILLHDGYVGRWQTARALPLIIQGLRARGLTPVTLPELLAGQAAPPTPTATATPTPIPPTAVPSATPATPVASPTGP